MKPIQSIDAAALRWLARREYTVVELSVRLVRGGFSAEDIKSVLLRLMESGYQDDQRVGAAWARHWVSRGWGPVRIVAQLLQKGLCKADASGVVEALAVDWYALAQRVSAKKKGTPMQIARFLLGRGFTAEQIKRIHIKQVVIHEADEC
jgi:regulatory protein